MKRIMQLTLVFVLMGSVQSAQAQQENKLLGKWDIEYVGEKEKAVYEFRMENGKVKGYSILIIDEKGTEYKDNSLVLENIEFDGDEGEADYSMDYEGEKYEMECEIDMASDKHIVVKYSYWGYKGKEVWRKKI